MTVLVSCLQRPGGARHCESKKVFVACTHCWHSLLVRSHFGSRRTLPLLGGRPTALGIHTWALDSHSSCQLSCAGLCIPVSHRPRSDCPDTRPSVLPQGASLTRPGGRRIACSAVRPASSVGHGTQPQQCAQAKLVLQNVSQSVRSAVEVGRN